MRRRRGWLFTLGPIGSASLIYVVVVRGFVAPGTGHELAWPLLGAMPLFVFGVWLLSATSSRAALYVVLGSTGVAVGSAYEIFLVRHQWLLQAEAYPLINIIGLTADALATVGVLLMLAGFPGGVAERRWQRIALRSVWAVLLVGPLTLLSTPYVVMPTYSSLARDTITNPYAEPALAWAVPLVHYLVVQPWPAAALGLIVFYTRALLGSPQTRAEMRVICWVTTATLISYLGWTLSPVLGVESTPLGWLIQLAVYLCMIALPLAGIHGILRYGAFDVALSDRGRFTVRSSTMLITVIYGIGVASPAIILLDRLSAVSAILLTALLAVGLLPVRGRLQQWIRRTVLGDRDRQLILLSEFGARLEEAIEPGELLGRLADVLRDGLDASWVRIRVVSPDETSDRLVESGTDAGGVIVGEPVAVQDLVQATERLGRIEIGPRRHGEYRATELSLLRTIAGQATTAVANLLLTARLAEQLTELTASRTRLVAAQDDERRRLERNLHDGIQQNVVALIAGLRLARNRLGRSELTAAELTELQDQARETLTDLREIAQGIHPAVLGDNGLLAAVESGVARFPITLSVVADDAVRGQRLSEDVEATAYYVVREALTNVAKHAGATNARVDLARSDGRLLIRICDDGRGIGSIDPAAVGGLANMRDRVSTLRGTLSVTANQPSGTTVSVELPIESERLTDA